MATPTELVEQIGHALRLARRRRRLSQRGLATELGVSKSTLASLESDKGNDSFERVLHILHGAGFDLELVDLERDACDVGEPPAEVRDAAGRRFPAHADPRPITFPHHWWFVRHPVLPRRYWPTWTWSRPRQSLWPVKSHGVNPAPLSKQVLARAAARARRDSPRGAAPAGGATRGSDRDAS